MGLKIVEKAWTAFKGGVSGVANSVLDSGLASMEDVIKDQYKEYFICEGFEKDILAVKGKKRDIHGKNQGVDNIISNGSLIVVNEGQCMIIVDQGKIVEFCAEPGAFEYTSSSEPSLFCGNLGQSLKNTFATVGKRITFAGDTAKDQRVYYIKINEVRDNAWGTQNPIPFFIHDKVTGFQGDINLIANGMFVYKITDPLAFYRAIGSFSDKFNKTEIHATLRSSFLTALQGGLGEFSEVGLRYSQITTMAPQLVESLNKQLSKTWGEERGITLVDIMFNTIKATEEDEKRIKKFQDVAVYTNVNMAAARMAESQANAMEMAASNESTGPMMAFAGMNMAQMSGGMNAGNLFAMGQQQQAAAPQAVAPSAAPAVNGWTCSCGKAGNTGKFCAECGSKKPDDAGWTCSCGHVNQGKFCAECGSKKPAGAPLYKCDKCGWEPEDPANPPKFCPECGDIFDENDIK